MRAGTWLTVGALVFSFGCTRESTQPRTPPNYGYPQPQQPGYPPSQGPGYPQPQQPGYPPPQFPQAPPTQPSSPQPASPSTPAPAPPVGSFDATGSMTQQFIRQEAQRVLRVLVASLPARAQARVKGIPLVVLDQDPTEVNAFAGCHKSRGAYMGITGGLLVIQASSSEARAFDELTGTKKYDQYLNQVAGDVRGHRAVRPLQPGALPLPTSLDPRKLSRQRLLFDEQLAFALGHELAHHYRGHTGCANGTSHGQISAQDVGRVAANVVPLFNQPLEVEADVNGIRSVLDAGLTQPSHWNEEGAMMTLGFFDKLSGFGPDVLFLGFLRSHPPPAIRIPIVRGEANRWHQQHGSQPAGGAGSSAPAWPFPIPIPGFGG